jgi:hypothetical protein
MSRSAEVNFRARARFGNPAQHNERQGMHIDWLFDLREKLLDKLSGVQADDVLNDSAAGSIPDFGTDPAADLKRALDRIKSIAVDDSGVHVDYAALRTSAAYQEFRRVCSPHLRTSDPARMTYEGQMAFWINLYNALVMNAVIAFDVHHSVAEGHLGQLTFFRRAAYNVAGRRVSLDDIEYGILRANRGHPFLPGPHFTSKDARLPWVLPLDPRVHFALNCASRSCPPIQVYSADQLEAQLDLAARNFVDSNVKINPAKQLLIVSSLFQWFKGDFGGRDGIVSFLIDHLPFDGRRAWLSKKQDVIKLSYEPYDWSINTAE